VTQASALALERLAYRRSRARRSTLAAVASTLVFAGAVGFGIKTPEQAAGIARISQMEGNRRLARQQWR